MDEYDPDYFHASHDEVPKMSFWRKLGGGSLSISIIVHAILLAIGVVWIFQVIPQKEEQPDFMPKGGGGGTPGAKSETNMKKRATMTTMNAPKLAAKGVTSTFTLPEPDPAQAMSSVGALGSSGLAAGLGGSGSGGGKGNGKGKGFGDGMGPGMGGGAGKMINPFGMLNPNANALVGTFYDTKQDSRHKDTGMTPEKLREVIKQFCKGGWNEHSLEKYYQASQKLYNTKIYIPIISADEAPKAFGCDKEVQPRCWIAIYRGVVSPPKSGKFRFVGAGDDVLAVRFNGHPVFDHGYTQGTSGLYMPGHVGVMDGTKKDREVENIIRESPMRVPVTFYKYDTTQNWNNSLGGLAVGPEFSVNAGNNYPIEIMISEIPGGLMGAALMIQEDGVTYEKTSNGSPILPIFRLDNSLPPKEAKDGSPPYDPNGPVWKLVGGSGKRDI